MLSVQTHNSIEVMGFEVEVAVEAKAGNVGFTLQVVPWRNQFGFGIGFVVALFALQLDVDLSFSKHE